MGGSQKRNNTPSLACLRGQLNEEKLASEGALETNLIRGFRTREHRSK